MLQPGEWARTIVRQALWPGLHRASSRLSIAVKNADGDLDGDYKSCLMDVVMGILQLSREKIWLKEPCYDLLTVLLQGNMSATGEQGAIPPLDAAAVAAVVLPTLESIFEGSTLQDYSPESLHLAFALGMCVKRCGSILSAEQKEKWRSVKTIVRLPKKLWKDIWKPLAASSSTAPRLHSVWPSRSTSLRRREYCSSFGKKLCVAQRYF